MNSHCNFEFVSLDAIDFKLVPAHFSFVVISIVGINTLNQNLITINTIKILKSLNPRNPDTDNGERSGINTPSSNSIIIGIHTPEFKLYRSLDSNDDGV